MPHPAASAPKNPRHPAYPVTRRELQFLTLAGNGRTNDAIARQLGVSPETVKGMLLKARRKLGGRDRTHAVALAMARGLIRPEDIRPAEGGR